ncbi:hypothetical protein LX36DRAFT_182831 [Colletotrichum falcatum]|nr:hypothetical protein LX36DRAFT_182831 [Colletotrichum falcatum]
MFPKYKRFFFWCFWQRRRDGPLLFSPGCPEKIIPIRLRSWQKGRPLRACSRVHSPTLPSNFPSSRDSGCAWTCHRLGPKPTLVCGIGLASFSTANTSQILVEHLKTTRYSAICQYGNIKWGSTVAENGNKTCMGEPADVIPGAAVDAVA